MSEPDTDELDWQLAMARGSRVPPGRDWREWIMAAGFFTLLAGGLWLAMTFWLLL